MLGLALLCPLGVRFFFSQSCWMGDGLEGCSVGWSGLGEEGHHCPDLLHLCPCEFVRNSICWGYDLKSQTSDDMDRWKSRGGKSQRREKKKGEDQRRKRVRRKKMQVREKVETSRFTMICGSGGSKRRRSQLARWEMKTCTPLCEAHFQLKMYNTPHARSNFGNWDVEKVHAIVVRSTFPSQNVQSTPCPEHLEVDMSGLVEKVHAVVTRSTFPSQNVKSTTSSDHFWTFNRATPHNKNNDNSDDDDDDHNNNNNNNYNYNYNNNYYYNNYNYIYTYTYTYNCCYYYYYNYYYYDDYYYYYN